MRFFIVKFCFQKNDKKRDDVMKKLKQQGGRKLNDNYFPLSGKSSMSYVAPPRRTGCPGGC